MAGTVVQTLLVSVCLLNTNLLCVQAGSFQRPNQQKKADPDYTFEVRDAKVVSFLPEYYSNQTTIYATMYNDSFTVVDGIIELLKILPPDAMLMIELSKFDPSTNKWSKRTSAVKPILVCDFINNNVAIMNIAYQHSNFTAKECPVYPGVYDVQHLHLDTAMFPIHLPESTYRVFIEIKVTGSNKPAISVCLVVDIVPKTGNDD